MFIKDLNFSIEFTPFSEKHFCKSFLKKYKAKKWVETIKTLRATLERSYMFQQSSLIDTIVFSQEEDIGIFKLDFAIAGTNTSPKGSGNRTIFSLCNRTSQIKVLFVYGKDNCPKKKSETQWIQEIVKSNFPELKDLF